MTARLADLATRDQAAIRDIPRTCTCDWAYRWQPCRWECARPDPLCIWHKRKTTQ